MVELFYSPDVAVHPGATLDETLETLGMSQVELAVRTGLTTKHISQIIHGKASITPETAIKLERVLGVRAGFWNNLEKNYHATLAHIQSCELLEQEKERAARFTCYKELVDLGVVEKVQSRDHLRKSENLLRYFRVDSLAFIPKIECTVFRNMKGEVNQESLAAWLRYGEIEAEKMEVGEFNPKGIKDALDEAKKLLDLPDGFSKKLQVLFAKNGVAIVYAPYFKQTKINGATRWVGDKAVIQLNIKGTYADTFWFTFFHEVGHLLLHGKKDQFLDFPMDGEKKDEKEKEADEFAVAQLIPPEAYQNFLRDGLGAVQDAGVDRGILAGRLAHEGKITWAFANRFRKRLKFIPDKQ